MNHLHSCSFNSQNFREMVPLLGVFRIVAIVILGTHFYLLPTLCVCVFKMFDSHLFCVFCVSWDRFWICLLQTIWRGRGWFEGISVLRTNKDDTADLSQADSFWRWIHVLVVTNRIGLQELDCSCRCASEIWFSDPSPSPWICLLICFGSQTGSTSFWEFTTFPWVQMTLEQGGGGVGAVLSLPWVNY